jgi:hypothetical protein
MSAELGLDVLRLRNRFGYTGDDDLSSAGEIVSGVAASLGREPTLLLTSWSPPATMKANGTVDHRGDLSPTWHGWSQAISVQATAPFSHLQVLQPSVAAKPSPGSYAWPS